MVTMSDDPPKPVPSPSPGTRWFWDALEDGRFLIQRCTVCSEPWFYPSTICPQCGHDEWDTFEADGHGVVESHTMQHHAPNAAFESDVPYPIVLVELDEGVRVMGNLVDCDPETVEIGDDVELVWERRQDGVIYQFTPTPPR